MIEQIDQNFNMRTRFIPSKTGMHSKKTNGFSFVDSGLSCDSFNVLHIYNAGEIKEEDLKSAVNYYRAKKIDFCVWVEEKQANNNLIKMLEKLDLKLSGTEAAMSLDLSEISAEYANDPAIRQVTSISGMMEFACVISENWNPPDQNILNFYKETAAEFLNSENKIILLLYYKDGKPVSALEIFPSGEEVVGLYNLSTLTAFRGRGIGTRMVEQAIQLAKKSGYKKMILQASFDGIGIYKKLGFKQQGQYYEYQGVKNAENL
jgi:GNAT superfamily N-acetyltransferase